jgi:2-iminobutanoate/2-iminopropanoate deaminase
MEVNMKIIESKNAPLPIGPYSQAVEVNGFIFTSGQIAIDPSSNQLIEGNAAEQTKQVLENLKQVLSAAGASLDNVVKTTIFIKNMDDFGAVNEVYAGYFSANRPARSTVEVARLPKDVLVEIDCIAVK